jgi:two-component sensor histidine kinase
MTRDAPSRSLSVYLAILVTLALLPLGIIAVVQTRTMLTDADELSRQALLTRTFAAARIEREALKNAVGASAGLAAAIPALRDTPERCTAMMQRIIRDDDAFIFAGFIDTSGQMTCANTGGPVDFSGSEVFRDQLRNPRLEFSINRSGQVTGQSVLIVTRPVFSDDRLEGFVSISIPHAISQAADMVENPDKETIFALYDDEGEVLAANADLDTLADFLPTVDQKQLALDRSGETFAAVTRSGEERIFAIATLIPDEIAVIGSWPKTAALASVGSTHSSLTLALPILMWVAGLAVALWGLDRLVVRHLATLRRALRRFALGNRSPMPNMQDAPEEFQYLRTAFDRMVMLVGEGEWRTEQDLQEKTVLLREVHHRVKNNLQLVASIMNMHARTAQTPETRRLLAQLQRRVRGLAMVHQTLNDDSRMTTIDTRTLIGRLVSELAQPAPMGGQNVHVRFDAISVELGQDQSVALSMLLAEALTNAVKYVGQPSDGTRPAITVTLSEDSKEHLLLLVRNTRNSDETPSEDEDAILTSGGVGQGLMRAFVAQMEGEAEVIETPSDYTYQVRFRVSADDPAQAPKPLETDTAPANRAAE